MFIQKAFVRALVTVFLFNVITTEAQSLSIGETTPDSLLTHVLNLSESSIRLSTFHSKLILLDFWNTRCSGCIAAFPRMEALQARYGDRIQIILVNPETQQVTLDFFAHHKRVKMPGLPMITEDSVLRSFFPYTTVPQHVWMDSSRHIYAITDGWNATPEHIDAFLKDHRIRLSVKKHDPFTETYLPLMAVIDTAMAGKSDYYSYILPSTGNTGSLRQQATDGGNAINRIALNEASILELLRTAYEAHRKYNFTSRNTVRLEVTDTFRYVYPRDDNRMDEWMENNSFLYELRVPPNKAAHLYEYMQQDLSRIFPIQVSIVKEPVTCMVLIRTDQKIHLLHSKDSLVEEMVDSEEDHFSQIKNMPWGTFVKNFTLDFAYTGFSEPLVDATGLSGDLQISYSDAGIFGHREMHLEAFRKLLHAYGLDLVVKKWPTNVLVVREAQER